MSYFSIWLDDLIRGVPESGVSSAPWTKAMLTVSPRAQSALLSTSWGNIQQQDIWEKWADCPMRVGDGEDKSRLLTLDGSVGGQQLSSSGAELGRPCPCTPSSSKVAWCIKVPVEVALLRRNTYQPFQKQLQNAGQIYTFSLTSLLLDCAILPSSICHLRAILISRTIFIKSFSVIRI